MAKIETSLSSDSIDSLRRWHSELFRKTQERMTSEVLREVRDFIDDCRSAGRSVSDPEDREYLRSLLQWGGFIIQHSEDVEYLDLSLLSFEGEVAVGKERKAISFTVGTGKVVEELSATYQLFEWWKELSSLLALLQIKFSPCLTVAERVTTEHKLGPIDYRTIQNALEQSQRSLNDIRLHILGSTEDEGKRSDKQVEEDLGPFQRELLEVLQMHYGSVKKGLQSDNLALLVNEIDNFGDQLYVSFSYVDRCIKELLGGKIGKVAAQLQQEADRVVGEQGQV